MARIRVYPEHLFDMAGVLEQTADNVEQIAVRLSALARSLDWETRSRSSVDADLGLLREKASALNEQAFTMAHFLKRTSEDFAAADHAGVTPGGGAIGLGLKTLVLAAAAVQSASIVAGRGLLGGLGKAAAFGLQYLVRQFPEVFGKHRAVEPQVGTGAGINASPAPAPAPAPTWDATKSAAKIREAIAKMETGRDAGFGRLTGNFDRQGWSFGILQWNFGQGTLQEMLRDPRVSAAIDRVLTRDEAEQLHAVAAMGPAGATAWARERLDARGAPLPEWRDAMAALGADPAVQAVQQERFEANYLKKAEDWSDRLGFKSEQALGMLTDIAVQNGPHRLYNADEPTKTLLAYEKLVEERQAEVGREVTEPERLLLLAKATAQSASPQWAENVWRRKIAYVTGGTANGIDLGALSFSAEPMDGIKSPYVGETISMTLDPGIRHYRQVGEDQFQPQGPVKPLTVTLVWNGKGYEVKH